MSEIKVSSTEKPMVKFDSNTLSKSRINLLSTSAKLTSCKANTREESVLASLYKTVNICKEKLEI